MNTRNEPRSQCVTADRSATERCWRAALAISLLRRATARGCCASSSISNKGAPHGMCTTLKDKVNEELLSFIES